MRGDKIVLVEWLDATHTDEAVHADDKVGLRRWTVGWVVADHEGGLVLAMDTSDEADEAYSMGFTIPRAYIRDVTRLRRGRKEE